MINYNITVNVDADITKDWLDWMKKEHIPDVMSSGAFLNAQIKKVITRVDNGNTFAITYTCDSMKDLHHYQVHFSDDLQRKHIARYGDKAVAFRTIMQVIQEF